MAKKRAFERKKLVPKDESGLEIHEDKQVLDESPQAIPFEKPDRQAELLALMYEELLAVAHRRKTSIHLGIEYALEYEDLIEQTAENEVQTRH